MFGNKGEVRSKFRIARRDYHNGSSDFIVQELDSRGYDPQLYYDKHICATQSEAQMKLEELMGNTIKTITVLT